MDTTQLRVFCIGWYNNDNLGDEAFKPAFEELWPSYTFTFSNSWSDFDRSVHDVVIIGAGSVLDSTQYIKQNIPVPYAVIGVTIDRVTPELTAFLDNACIVVVRDQTSQDRYPNAIVAGDIVLGRMWTLRRARKRQIVILVNDFFNANSKDPAWEMAAKNWMVGELGKLVDSFLAKDYTVKFLPLGLGVFDDRRMAATVINEVTHPTKVEWVLERQTEMGLVEEIMQSELVITQRFHGFVYSIATSTPCMVICGNNKMWSLARDTNWKGTVDFYGFNHVVCRDNINSDVHKFDLYRDKVYKQWQDISVLVGKKFSDALLGIPAA